MRAVAAPAAVWAVVKADGYGHGASTVSRAALRRRVRRALRGAHCRRAWHFGEAGIEAPILILSEQPPDHAATIVANRLIPTVTTTAGVEALRAAGADAVDVHVKVDTGMHRVGAAPSDVPALVAAIEVAAPRLRLGGDVHPPRRRRRAGRIPTRPGNSRCFDEVLGVLLARRRRRRARRQLGGHPRPSRGAAVVRSRRHRRVRRLTRPWCRRPRRRPPSGAVAACAGLLREAARRGVPAVVRTAPPTHCRRDTSRPSPSATPTESGAASRPTATS